MSAEENTQTAKDGYAAFGRGDVPAILELLTDGIEWVDPVSYTHLSASDIEFVREYTRLPLIAKVENCLLYTSRCV